MAAMQRALEMKPATRTTDEVVVPSQTAPKKPKVASKRVAASKKGKNEVSSVNDIIASIPGVKVKTTSDKKRPALSKRKATSTVMEAVETDVAATRRNAAEAKSESAVIVAENHEALSFIRTRAKARKHHENKED